MPESLHVAWVNELAQPVGGAERYVAATAGRLGALGVRSVLLYEPTSRVSTEMTGAFEGAFPIIDLGRQLASLRPDVIYVHQVGDPAVLDALASCGRPVLHFIHDHKLFCLREGKFTTLGGQTCTRTIGPACYPCLGFVHRAPSWPGVRLTTVGGLRARHDVLRALAGIVVGSQYMASHVAAHGFDRGRIHVLPLWVDRPASEAPVEREPDLLLTVGQLIRGKGHDVLIDALTRTSRPVRLAVVGTGRRETALRAQAATLGLSGRVTFLGRLSPDDLAAWYRRAACVVLPTRAPETFGLVGVEAASHATPVIASRVGGVPEWLQDGESGLLVPANDPEALAGAIDAVVGDPVRARAMGETGRALHLSRYLPEHHLAALVELFQATAATGARAR